MAQDSALPKPDGVKASDLYPILSIDGGGILGIIPGVLLVEIEKLIRRKTGIADAKIGEYFKMVAGTSTGGILSLLLLCPSKNDPKKARFSAADALQLYLDNGDEIFDRSLWQRISSGGGLSDEKYSVAHLEKVLLRYFQDVQLKDLIAKSLIPSYNTKGYQPHFFTQHDADIPGKNFLIRDVARATSAAPTYFQPANTESLDDVANAMPMIDGGVFANNPSACAVVEALAKGGMAEASLQRILLISLGTGRKPKSIRYNECKDWGLLGWARPVIEIMMEGVSQTVDYQIKTLFKASKCEGNYFRIDGTFGDTAARLDIAGLVPELDAADNTNMRRLQAFGTQLASNHSAELDRIADLLIAQKRP